MSEENIQLVRRGIDAFNRRDAETWAALGTPEAEIIPMRAAVEGTSYRGPEGAARFFAETDEIWGEISVELTESPIEVDDRTIYAQGRRFSNGLVSSTRTYTDIALAREDAGLSE
jgi:ketosteroid isomerase-like protein